MDDPFGIVGMAVDAIQLAAHHQPISVCMNPTHDHTYSNPCDDHCMDHIHQCDKGCGEWPCKIVQIGKACDDLVVQAKAGEAAYHMFMHQLGHATADLHDALEKETYNRE